MIKSIIYSILLLAILSPKLMVSQELARYSCLVDRVKIKEFEKSFNRTFDKSGVLLSKGQYHGLAIAQFGILSYYEFLETGDSVYYNHVINQARFFKDSTKVHAKFEGKGIGIPYHKKFGDLEAPWYSGMTQGYAISFLLRYFDLTGDEESLPLIKKLLYFLKLPQSEGGTISITDKGFKWIEEYPNSKK